MISKNIGFLVAAVLVCGFYSVDGRAGQLSMNSCGVGCNMTIPDGVPLTAGGEYHTVDTYYAVLGPDGQPTGQYVVDRNVSAIGITKWGSAPNAASVLSSIAELATASVSTPGSVLSSINEFAHANNASQDPPSDGIATVVVTAQGLPPSSSNIDGSSSQVYNVSGGQFELASFSLTASATGAATYGKWTKNSKGQAVESVIAKNGRVLTITLTQKGNVVEMDSISYLLGNESSTSTGVYTQYIVGTVQSLESGSDFGQAVGNFQQAFLASNVTTVPTGGPSSGFPAVVVDGGVIIQGAGQTPGDPYLGIGQGYFQHAPEN